MASTLSLASNLDNISIAFLRQRSLESASNCFINIGIDFSLASEAVANVNAPRTRGSFGGASSNLPMLAALSAFLKSAIESMHSPRIFLRSNSFMAISCSTAMVSGDPSPRNASTAWRRDAMVGPFFACARNQSIGQSIFNVFSAASRGSNATHCGGPSSGISISAFRSRHSHAMVFWPEAVRTQIGVLTRMAGVRSSIFCVCSALIFNMRVAAS